MAYLLEDDKVMISDQTQLSWPEIEAELETQDYLSVMSYDMTGYLRSNLIDFEYQEKEIGVKKVVFEDDLELRTGNHLMIGHRWALPSQGDLVRYYHPKEQKIKISKVSSVESDGYETSYLIKGIVGMIINEVPCYA